MVKGRPGGSAWKGLHVHRDLQAHRGDTGAVLATKSPSTVITYLKYVYLLFYTLILILTFMPQTPTSSLLQAPVFSPIVNNVVHLPAFKLLLDYR